MHILDTAVPFTAVDNSIDIVGAVLFAIAIFWALHYLWENHLTTAGRILYIKVIGLSLAHIYQVVVQLTLHDFASFRVWDIMNYMTAMLFLMLVHRLAKKEKL